MKIHKQGKAERECIRERESVRDKGVDDFIKEGF